ncbi:MAG: hypothetical protein KatS3mg011_1240 [Acidimicrobiia bacterium]|nr:MAG: hypothetical protein KatS3mg011_1240 [Acidimicrobiia bacterium]
MDRPEEDAGPSSIVGSPKPTRSRSDRVIAGVCGGLARSLGVDPILIRVAFLAAAFIQGVGLLAYIVLWLVMPEEDSTTGNERDTVPNPALRRTVGWVMVGVGALVLADRLAPGLGDLLWPAALIAIGLVLALGKGPR